MANKPDYTLHALDKATGEKNKVGAAWIMNGGRISIKLDPFVVLANRNGALVLSLFHTDETKLWDKGKASNTEEPDPTDSLLTETDIPF